MIHHGGGCSGPPSYLAQADRRKRPRWTRPVVGFGTKVVSFEVNGRGWFHLYTHVNDQDELLDAFTTRAHAAIK
jgi:hypothetical protein